MDLLSVQINEWLWCLKADMPKYINFYSPTRMMMPENGPSTTVPISTIAMQRASKRVSEWKQTITLADFSMHVFVDDFIFMKMQFSIYSTK